MSILSLLALCYARLSAVLKLSTSAAVVPVHISHKVCIRSWSCDWWSGMRSIYIINWWCSMTMLSLSAATICNKCQHIKHTVVLALMFCTSECCTWLGTYHVRCAQSHYLCVLVYMKQHLMSWDLQHTASSFLLKWTQLLVLLGKYGCFKIRMKRHYGNSSLNLSINCYKNGR